MYRQVDEKTIAFDKVIPEKTATKTFEVSSLVKERAFHVARVVEIDEILVEAKKLGFVLPDDVVIQQNLEAAKSVVE